LKDGKVGIGTSSPSELLNIVGASNPRVRFDQTGAERDNFVGLLGDADQLAISADESNLGTNSHIVFRVDASEHMRIDSSGNVGIGTSSPGEKLEVNGNIASNHVLPNANDTYDLGASGNVWRNLYTGDLHLSNEAKEEGNAVDGTKGSWTIQEGAEHLYILNNKSGKKYKFKLEEI